MSKHEDRFIKIVSYIEANLDADLDVSELSRLTCLSKFHFHRQCSAFFGISVISLVKLMRLKRAAYQLAFRDSGNILDIALANGYESHEAFSRVFKKHFALSPSDFRESPDWTPWYKNYEPILKLRSKIMRNTVEFNVQIVEFPDTNIAVMEHRGAPNLLGKTIQRFINWRKLNRLPPRRSRTFNLLYDDPKLIAPEDFRFDLCCSVNREVDRNEYGVFNSVIPEGKCAVVRHIGSDDTIDQVVNFLFSDWLRDSNFEVRDYPLFLERVSFFPEVPENEMITDIYLPIR